MELILCDLNADIQDAVVRLSKGKIDQKYKADYDPESMTVKIKIFADSFTTEDLKRLVFNNKFKGFSECEDEEAIILEFIVK